MNEDSRLSRRPGVIRRQSTIFRHSLLVRITHWVNVVCLAILLMSGLQIFNAHPALDLGNRSFVATPLFSLNGEKHGGVTQGVTTVLGKRFLTTGVLGASSDGNGDLVDRGFPSWATLPSWQDLATGRRWHFFFAWLFVVNGFVYLAYSLLSGHAWRDLVPTGEQLRHIGRSIWDHLRFRFPEGEEAKYYNVLQRLSYFAVVFLLLPITVLAGLTMSPALDTAAPWLLDLFGGRQSARTVHFVCALLIVLFILVHVFMVLVSGFWNNMRSMITGRYAIKEESHE